MIESLFVVNRWILLDIRNAKHSTHYSLIEQSMYTVKYLNGVLSDFENYDDFLASSIETLKRNMSEKFVKFLNYPCSLKKFSNHSCESVSIYCISC